MPTKASLGQAPLRELTGRFLRLPDACRDILTPALLPPHPLGPVTPVSQRVNTTAPRGALGILWVTGPLSLGCDVLVCGGLGEALLPVPAPPAWTLLTY